MDDHFPMQPAPTPELPEASNTPEQPWEAFEQDTVDGAVQEPPTPAVKRAVKRSVPRRSEMAMLRRSAQLALDINVMEFTDRDLLAGVLGLGAQTGTADIAATAARSTAKDWRAGLDAAELLSSDPMEAAITATALGRPRLAAVWRLFAIFGSVPVEMPASEAKAALALARSLGDDTVELRTGIERALDRLAS